MLLLVEVVFQQVYQDNQRNHKDKHFFSRVYIVVMKITANENDTNDILQTFR